MSYFYSYRRAVALIEDIRTFLMIFVNIEYIILRAC